MSERDPVVAKSSGKKAGHGNDSVPEPAVSYRTRTGWHRRAEMRTRILEAALQVYAEKGADVPVTDDFVKAAGVSRGSLYNHFATPAELLEATIECFANELAQAIVDAIEPSDDVVANAATAMRLHLHWVTADPMICAFFAKIPQVGEAGRRHAQAQYRRGIEIGAFSAVDEDAANDLLFGTLYETIRRVARSPDKPMRLDEVVTRVLTGLGVNRAKIEEVMRLPLPPIRLQRRVPGLDAALIG